MQTGKVANVFFAKIRNMKILFVIDTYNTNNNGTSISAQRFAGELRKRGHEVRILTAGEPSEEIYGLPRVHVPVFQPLMNKHNFFFAKAKGEEVEKTIRTAVEWADIVHCFLPFPVEIAAQKYAKKINKPCTGAYHMQPESITANIGLHKFTWLTNRLYQLFRRKMYDGFRHVHCPSKFMADTIKEQGYKAKLHVISNGIQKEFIDAGQRNTSGSRPHPEKFAGKVVIMMVGRLTREKQQALIMRAVPYSKYADRIQLIFAGCGPMLEKYKKIGETLPLKPMFVYVKRDELIELLSEADLYVHAADMESEAISCIEAFASGLVPVIANSKLSATTQFALDERSLFEAGNPKDLARAIDYWLDNLEERERMEKVYANSAVKYSLENSVSMFEDMLKEELEDHEKYNKN